MDFVMFFWETPTSLGLLKESLSLLVSPSMRGFCLKELHLMSIF